MGRIFVVILVVCAAGVGCGEVSLPPAGSYSDVALFAEGDGAGEWARRLTDLLTRERDYFVTAEAPFHVTVVPADRVREAQPVKNVVLCGVLGGESPVSVQIASLLDRGQEESVGRRGGGIFCLEDRSLPGQTTVVVTATGADALRRVLEDPGADIQELIDASARARLRRNLMERPNRELMDALRERHGFRLDVPSIYQERAGNGGPPGVELYRDAPPRVLGVFWRPWDHAPSPGDEDTLFAVRAEYVRRRYDGDRMDRQRVRFAPARLGVNSALCMGGYWHNDRREPYGGYYETYFVWDGVSQLLWAVDLLVYAPGREKTTLVRELQAIAESFRYE